jgi:RNA polymerase sigma-70 factor (ECF subfamily)
VIEAAYREHSRFVWGVCYRMTGSAADADELVQETFARALTSPPADTTAPWRPWLVRVAMNLARDRLRRRKRAPYTGPWLPAPIETGEETADEVTPEQRYGMLESVTFAFLLACEALTPRQRAVLLLRDVLDYSVEETATALELSAANVKTTHHRARAAMHAYDAARSRPTRELQDKTRAALERLAFALSTGDLAAVEAAFTPAAITITDAGGDYRAALRFVTGASRVGRFYMGLLKKTPPTRIVFRRMNGLPALVIEVDNPPPRVAPRLVVRCDVAEDGRIEQLHAILARAKLTGVDTTGAGSGAEGSGDQLHIALPSRPS